MKVRQPCQAGAFYAGSHNALKDQITDCFTHRLGPGRTPETTEKPLEQLIALICPHAGYMYSGSIAAHAYYRLSLEGKPDSVVIMGPNHTGLGSAISMMNEGAWRTPLGDVEIDFELAERILEVSEIIDVDEYAHKFEHSIEVQLPFLQYLFGSSFKFIPICFRMQDLESSREVGENIAEAVSERNILLIASTDMTHYESQKAAETKDRAVIDAVTKMDEVKLYRRIEDLRVSMCGYGPTAATIVASKSLGAVKAELLQYKTSGDITGDYSAVVGYASMTISR